MNSNFEFMLHDLQVYEQSPCQKIGDIYFKRDDLYAPFGAGSVNGGKLRQGAFMVAKAKAQGYKRIITGCSLISPQAPMIAAVCQKLKMECLVLYGGTKPELLEDKHMPRLTKHFGAEIQIAKSGRASVLLHTAKKIKQPGDYIILYGMNCKDSANYAAFYDTTAQQVQNLPEQIDDIAITCGSGITAAGVIYGLRAYNKKVKNIWLLGIAPNREKKVKKRLWSLSFHSSLNFHWAEEKFNYVDLFAEGLDYEKRVEGVSYFGIDFHPHYEAKTFQWVGENLLNKSKNLVYWIVGAEPTFLKDK